MSRFSTTPLNVFRVEGEGLLELCQDANEIDYETTRLTALAAVRVLLLEWAIDPRDGLKENVVPHGLIQVHAVEDGGVVACEQFIGDDEDLGVMAGLDELLSRSLFFVFAKLILRDEGNFLAIVVYMHVHGRR